MSQQDGQDSTLTLSEAQKGYILGMYIHIMYIPNLKKEWPLLRKYRRSIEGVSREYLESTGGARESIKKNVKEHRE